MKKRVLACLAMMFYVTVLAGTALLYDAQSDYLHQEKIQFLLIAAWLGLQLYVVALYFYWDAPDPKNPRKKLRDRRK